MKKLLSLLAMICLVATSFAQVENPVSWKTSVTKKATEGEYEIKFVATIASPWHLYDLGPYKDGPYPTAFTFAKNPSIELVGKVKQNSTPTRTFDEIFGMEIGYFAKTASFSQVVRVKGEAKTTLKASVEYQVCDDKSCLAPAENEFSFELEGVKATAKPQEVAPTNATTPGEEPKPTVCDSISCDSAIIVNNAPIEGSTQTMSAPEESGKSLWGVIIEAILWGFAALLTPCVFPMVPMTVSFFMKGSENRARGRLMASLYGIAIVVLYTLPIAVIILVTYFAGGKAVTADIFNWLATHWIPNVLFFAVFMVFAASFFGAFEITMPSWLVNKSDSKADKGGFAGLFFMALTLVLVSFSCTGPIVGSILIKSTQGEFWEPIITMLAFSIAFALPFTIFAFFPSFLNNLPKSGGWLNSVKVVLGFLEVALGFKFLSVADQTYHWGLLDREVYLAIWIVVFTLLGLYLLGKIKFSHDSEVKHIGITRLALVIATFTFVVYMIPGLWGAPLKALSGYLPPMHTQDFVVGGESPNSVSAEQSDAPKAKYSDFLHLPHNLTGFFDYDEALEYSRKVGKPLFVDFTGHGCVNCREMEAKVWSDRAVLKLLRENFVIVALYSDDKKELPESDWVKTESGKVLKSLGKINSRFANDRFGVNAQPYYVILNAQEKQMAPARAYNLDINAFVAFLEEGIKNYKQQ